VLVGAAAMALGGCSKGPDGPVSRSRPGERATAPASRPAPRIIVDEQARSVSVPAHAVKQGTYAELKGAIEYVLVAAGGKEYESLFVTEHSPREIHDALARVGLARGTPGDGESPPKGKPLRIAVEYVRDGKPLRRPIDAFVAGMKTHRPLDAVDWPYVGSADATNPADGKTVLQASLTRSVIGLHYSDASVLVQNPRPEAREENVYRANARALPGPSVPVRVVFRRVMPPIAPGTRRTHVFVSGRVQGVGFRAYAQRQARMLKLAGFVRNGPDGRVEAIAEGPSESVEKFLDRLRQGPRAARVENVSGRDVPPEGDAGAFEIRYE